MKVVKEFRKKPIVIKAMQFIGSNYVYIAEWMISAGQTTYIASRDRFSIKTLEGMMEVSVGDWIIKGIGGEFYPCKPDIFELTYDEVETT